MKNLYFAIMALSCLHLTGQIPTSLINQTKEIYMFDEYQGSIYNTLKYQKSALVDENSISYEVRLRYNIYSDALEFKNSDGLHNIIKNPSLHARIGSDVFYYCDFKNHRGIPLKGYFILIDQNDDYRVYKKLSLRIKEPENRSASFGVSVPGSIKQEVSYYLENDSKLLEIPTNKNTFFELFNDKKTELENFISSTKIKLKKEEDLIALMAKYNELINSDGQRMHSVLAAKMD